MIFDIVTIFPDYFAGPFAYGIVARAQKAGLVTVRVQDLRQLTTDRHQTVDDRPFGGGAGMVMKPEPLFAAVERLRGPRDAGGPRAHVVLLSAQGKLFHQEAAQRLAALEHVVLLCGRYEGVDERVATALADEELSIGDYVLTGGEPAAAIVVDAVTRLLPGALGNEESAVHESFSEVSGGNLLDYPHYTRPAIFRGLAVPEILLSGHHEQVRRWRRKKALEKTLHHRPELLEHAPLAADDHVLLAEILQANRDAGRARKQGKEDL